MFGYDTGTLRTGASVASDLATVLGSVSTTIGSTTVPTKAFGDVGAAGGLVAVLDEVRTRHLRQAEVAGANAEMRAVRLRASAYLGDQLTAATTSMATAV